MDTNIDKIFKLILEEANARNDRNAELNILLICFEILDRFRVILEDQDLSEKGVILLRRNLG